MTDVKALAREWIEIWGRGDPATLPLAEDFVHVSPFGRLEGRERYLAVVAPLAAQQVASLRVRDVIAEGGRACVRFTMTAASGPVECCDWLTFQGDRIAAVHAYYDPRGLPHFEEY